MWSRPGRSILPSYWRAPRRRSGVIIRPGIQARCGLRQDARGLLPAWGTLFRVRSVLRQWLPGPVRAAVEAGLPAGVAEAEAEADGEPRGIKD